MRDGRWWKVALVCAAMLAGCGQSDGSSESDDSAGEVGGDVGGNDDTTGDAATSDAGKDGSASDGTSGGNDVGDTGIADASGDGTAADATTDDTGDDATTDAGGPGCVTHADCPQPSEPCRAAVCAPPVGCVVVALIDGALCDDGNPCTLGDLCNKGLCQPGAPDACDDGNACTADDCAAPDGCVHLAADASPCDDGDSCTIGDACKGSVCAPGPNGCACKTSADCAAYDDGDACNGALYCDVVKHECVVNPATVPVCDTTGDNACAKTACVPATGQCVKTSLPTGSACDDGVACTDGDHCKDGACVPGTKTCCTADADCKDDGDLCNGTPFCNLAKGTCQTNPLTVVSCASGLDGPCLQTGCDKSSGTCKQTAAPDGKPCDDGALCTIDDACKDGACKPGTDTCACKSDAECKQHEDGNLCNGTLFCNAQTGSCMLNPATVITCPTGGDSACMASTCQPLTGECLSKPRPDGTACDADGNTCTPNDGCKAGACVADTNVCPCEADADCAAKEDGDLCNGTLYCNKVEKVCKPNPATIVFCDEVSGPHAGCRERLCNPKSGQCVVLPSNEGGVCDADGNACTKLDTCQKGECTADANTCACQKDADCAAAEDGNVCNGTLFCDKAKNVCVVNPVTVVQCAGTFDTACMHNVCVPATGKCAQQTRREGLHCDADGNACTLYDVCQQGACQPGANVCDCAIDGDCGVFEDGNPCNGVLICTGEPPQRTCQVNDKTVVKCPLGDAEGCERPVCAPKTGQCAPVAWPDGKPCTDAEPCTTDTVCAAGACKGGVTTACDDNNPCTDDACKAGEGCVALPNQATCVDGNACTKGDACLGGSCKGTPVGKQGCDDGNPCTEDACEPKTGCLHAPAAGGCDDGNACTSGDSCGGGVCKGGSATDCDDGNPCTADGCDKTVGCTHAAADGSCDDGSACTTGDACKDGACKGVAADCDDGDVCSDDTCASSDGSCKHTPKSCDDGDVCTDDGCHPKLGCLHVANSAACDDGNACTGGDACVGGKCTASKSTLCEDGNVCTDDSCDPKTGCTATANTAACDDGVGCTVQDACKDGICAGKLDCNDDNACTADACDPKTGACVHAGISATCDDGDACTENETCVGGVCKPEKVKVCDDGNVCTDDTCDSQKGCVAAANTAPCSLGACTTGDVCKDKICTAGSGERIYEGKLATPGVGELPTDMLLLPGGDVIFAGARAAPGPYGASPYAGVGRVTADASKLSWWSGLPTLSGTYARRLLRRKDGTIAVLNKPGQCLAVASVAEDGTLGTQTHVAISNCNASGGGNGGQEPGALGERIVDGKGQLLVFGTIAVYGNGEYVAALDDKGAVTTSFVRYTEWQNHYVNDGIVEPGGGVAYIGATGEAAGSLGANDIVLTRLDADLKQTGRWHYGTAGHDVGAALVAFGDGSTVLGGAVAAANNTTDSWVARVDAKGQLLWQRTQSHGDIEQVTRLVRAADGQLYFLARVDESPGGVADARFGALSASGVPLWTRSYGATGRHDDLAAMALAANGDLVLLGRDMGSLYDYAGADLRLLHADRWGFLSCQSAGKCAAVSQKGCDDGKVCTADWCDASEGCKAQAHTGLCSDGDACTDIDLCNDAGTCVPGSAIGCDDGNACTTETCDKTAGCTYKTMQDGVGCGTGKVCAKGSCVDAP